MSSEPLRVSSELRPPYWGAVATVLGLWMFVGLSTFAAVLSLMSVQNIRAVQLQEANARAEFVCRKLMRRIDNALEVGIPVSGLQGVQAMFEAQLKDVSELRSLTLTSSEGQVLFTATRLDERSSGTTQAAALTARSPPSSNHTLAVQAQYQAPSLAPLAISWGLTLVCLALLMSFASSVLLRARLASGLQRRYATLVAVNGALQQTALTSLRKDNDQGKTGQISWCLPVLPRQEHDLRPQWLSDHLRAWRESRAQLLRRALSLQKTETNTQRHLELSELSRGAAWTDGDGFAGSALNVLPQRLLIPEPSAIQKAFWSFVLATLAVSLLTVGVAAQSSEFGSSAQVRTGMALLSNGGANAEFDGQISAVRLLMLALFAGSLLLVAAAWVARSYTRFRLPMFAVGAIAGAFWVGPCLGMWISSLLFLPMNSVDLGVWWLLVWLGLSISVAALFLQADAVA